MCGIVGALAFGKVNQRTERIRQKVMQVMTTELLLVTEARGEDATGAAILFADGNYVGIKRGEKSSSFLGKFGKEKEHYGGLLKTWREYDHPVKAYIGHCRKGTTGDKEDNVNNHPIKVRNIIGVHNGVIRNDDLIFKHLGSKRDGKVDSEAVIRLMHYFTNKGQEPFTMDMLEEIIARLTGAFAVLAFNADNLNQIPVFRDGRPMEFIFVKDLSLLFIVSEIKFWNMVHYRYERMVNHHGLKAPSTLGMEIETKMLPEDTAMLFDLTTKCTKDTSIDDLGERKKISKDNKIWTSHTAISTSNRLGSHSYAGNQKMKEEPKKEDDNKTSVKQTDTKKDDTTTMQVFNKLTNKYELKAKEDPETLADDQSKIIPIESGAADSEDKEYREGTEDKDKNSQFKNDKADENESLGAKTLELEDQTNYERKQSTSAEEQSTTDESDSMSIVDVDMEQEDPELVATAEKAYKAIPDERRGYGDMENLLTDIEVKDAPTATSIGIQVVGNRVAKVCWKRGFIAGIKYLKQLKADVSDASEANVSKTVINSIASAKIKKQERHIYNLKSLVLVLSMFYNQMRTNVSPKFWAKKVDIDKQLADISGKQLQGKKVSIKEVSSVFNNQELRYTEEVRRIVEKNDEIDEKGDK